MGASCILVAGLVRDTRVAVTVILLWGFMTANKVLLVLFMFSIETGYGKIFMNI